MNIRYLDDLKTSREKRHPERDHFKKVIKWVEDTLDERHGIGDQGHMRGVRVPVRENGEGDFDFYAKEIKNPMSLKEVCSLALYWYQQHIDSERV